MRTGLFFAMRDILRIFAEDKLHSVMKYPIGIQDFEKLRRGGFLYVDKTALIYQLTSNDGYYFLSRPRRFGKSLLVSTLEAYFTGKRDLFEGLAIEKLETEWATYPVLHLDLNAEKYAKPEDLDNILNDTLAQWEAVYGTEPTEVSFSLRFKGVLRRACEKTGRQAIILIDEYDKPLLEAIGNKELTEDYRKTLSAFYSVMKLNDRYIKFGFLTGVTKFAKVSIFSGLNNLEDISMAKNYADICGITETELKDTFDESVKALATENKLTEDECYAKLRQMYDGYHFHVNAEGVYNPFSLLRSFKSREFGSYWFETGTPTFLTKVISRTDYDLSNLPTAKVTANDLGDIENISRSPIPVLYQAGYLTLKGYDARFKRYLLGFPNEEVEHGFVEYLLPTFVRKTDTLDRSYIENFVRDVEAGKPDDFLKRMQTMLSGNNYQVEGDKEVYFQNVMYVVFRLMGFFTHVERATSNGRIDLTIETPNYIYIIEIKRDASADKALQQILDKDYAAPFAHDPRRLFKIGVNYSSKTRRITRWKMA